MTVGSFEGVGGGVAAENGLARFGHVSAAVAPWTALSCLRVKYWEIIADNLSKAGCASPIGSEGRPIWIAEAHPRFSTMSDHALQPNRKAKNESL